MRFETISVDEEVDRNEFLSANKFFFCLLSLRRIKKFLLFL